MKNITSFKRGNYIKLIRTYWGFNKGAVAVISRYDSQADYVEVYIKGEAIFFTKYCFPTSHITFLSPEEVQFYKLRGDIKCISELEP